MAFNVIAAFIVIALGLGALAPAVVDGAGKETKPPASKTAPLDINTASVDGLKALPRHRRRLGQEDRGCPAV